MDIRDALAALGPPDPRPDPDVVAADLARGRRALARRRRRLAVAGTTLGIVGVLGLTGAVQVLDAGGPPARPAVDAVAPQAPLDPFVPYRGPRTGAFTTGLVPAGWTVQADGNRALVLAPPGADPDPAFYGGKVVALVNRGHSQRAAADGGTVVERGGDGGAAVEIDLPDGDHLVVQFPPGAAAAWTDAQLLRLARSVTVGPAAVPATG